MSQRHLLVSFILSCTLVAGGCSSYWFGTETRSGTSSSLVEFLYPDGEIPPGVAERMPHLELPVRVGIAFVPDQGGWHPVPAATRTELLEWVGEAFVSQPYIEQVEVIPDSYLRPAAGITGMQQVARLLNVDVIALVSYDQVATLEDNPGSLLYWTIVGAYIIPGTQHEVHSFVDTAVFDVETAQLLFRAPGVDQDEGVSAAVGSGTAQWATQNESFSAAMQDMRGNLLVELADFEDEVREGSAVATASYREGYGGGGSMAWLLVMLVVGIIVGRMSHRYNSSDVTRESRGGGLFVVALLALPMLVACGGGGGDGGAEEMVSPPDPAASSSSSGDLCNLAILFLADPNSACSNRSSSSSSSVSPVPTQSAPPVTVTLHRSAEMEPNNDVINANIPEFAVIPGRVGFVVDGAVSDAGDTEDTFAFVRPRSTNFIMQLCPPGDTVCTSLQAMPIDVGTAFIELLDADGQVLKSSADLEANILRIEIQAGVQYYLRVVAADTMGATVGYDLTAHETS